MEKFLVAFTFIKLCIDFASLNCIYFYIIFNNIFRLLGSNKNLQESYLANKYLLLKSANLKQKEFS